MASAIRRPPRTCTTSTPRPRATAARGTGLPQDNPDQPECRATSTTAWRRAGFARPDGHPGGSWWATRWRRRPARDADHAVHARPPARVHRPQPLQGLVHDGPRLRRRTTPATRRTGWRLPSGDYDVPLILARTSAFDPEHRRDDLQPVRRRRLPGRQSDRQRQDQAVLHEVERRKLPLPRCSMAGRRGSTARLAQGRGQPAQFTQITQSGNFLPAPKKGPHHIDLWVAERSDIIVDFTQVQDGRPGLHEQHAGDAWPTAAASTAASPPTRTRSPTRSSSFAWATLAEDADLDPGRLPAAAARSTSTRWSRSASGSSAKSTGMWHINGKFWDPDIDHSPEFCQPARQGQAQHGRDLEVPTAPPAAGTTRSTSTSRRGSIMSQNGGRRGRSQPLPHRHLPHGWHPAGRRDGGLHPLPRLPGDRLRQSLRTPAATSCTATTRCTRTTP